MAASDPLRAAQVYDNMVERILQADSASIEAGVAAARALDAAYPATRNSLIRQAEQSLQESTDLNATAHVLQYGHGDRRLSIRGLRRELRNRAGRLIGVDRMNDRTTKALTEVRQMSDGLPTSMASDIEATKVRANRATELAQSTLREALFYQQEVETELQPGIRRLADVGHIGSGFVEAERHALASASELDNALRHTMPKIERDLLRMGSVCDSLGDRMSTLRNRLAVARQRAATMQLSLAAGKERNEDVETLSP